MGASWGVGATGLWVQLFIFSKIPELVDTIFIVARDRPLIFLHPYHHVTVLLYCMHSYATEAPQALYFVAMNYSVHAIMYGYYCLMALKMKPAWLPPIVITVAQISQMFVGVAVQLVASYKHFADDSCHLNGQNIFWGGVMYASYFALFAKFAVDRYCVKKQKKVVRCGSRTAISRYTRDNAAAGNISESLSEERGNNLHSNAPCRHLRFIAPAG